MQKVPEKIRVNGRIYVRADTVHEAWNNEPTQPDPDAVRELHIWLQTSSEPMYNLLTKRYYPPLLKRIKNGTYDRNLAVKHFLNFTAHAAEAYNNEFGSPGVPWHQVFNKGTRREVAKLLLDDFESSDDYSQTIEAGSPPHKSILS